MICRHGNEKDCVHCVKMQVVKNEDPKFVAWTDLIERIEKLEKPKDCHLAFNVKKLENKIEQLEKELLRFKYILIGEFSDNEMMFDTNKKWLFRLENIFSDHDERIESLENMNIETRLLTLETCMSENKKN